MEGFFASGRVADLALALLAAEAAALWLLRRLSGRGPGLAAVLPFLLAGACLMLALRVALTGGDWVWVALPLVGAFAAHLADLARRWPR